MVHIEQLNISLTSHFSTETIDFLDIRLHIHQSGRIETELYRKASAANSLLHFESFHEFHIKKAVPGGQFARIRRNCTTDESFRHHAGNLTKRFLSRGYPKKVISSAYEQARSSKRETLLKPRPKSKREEIRLVTDYNNQWTDVRRILEKHWAVLGTDPDIKEYVKETPRITSRRAKNLRDHLCHSHFQRPSTPLNRGCKIVDSFPCGDCSICRFMIPKKEISNTDGDTIYKRIRQL